MIQDKSLFSLSIISGRLSPELALLLVFAKLTAEPLINPWDSSLRSISIIEKLLGMASMINGRLDSVNWPLPEIFNLSNPCLFNDSKLQSVKTSVVFLKFRGSEVELSESSIRCAWDEASIGDVKYVSKRIVVSNKIE